MKFWKRQTDRQTISSASFPNRMLTSTGSTELFPLLASPEEGNPRWCERSTCKWFADVYSPCLPNLVFPLIFTNLLWRHLTGLSPQEPSTAFLRPNDLCFGGLQAAGRQQDWKWSASFIPESCHGVKGGLSERGLVHRDHVGQTQDRANQKCSGQWRWRKTVIQRRILWPSH